MNEDVGQGMTSSGGRLALWVLAIVLVLLTLIVAFIPVPKITNANAAAILALVTAGAVAIERIIEGIWTIVGSSSLGSWWPLKPIGERLNRFVGQLNEPLNDFYVAVQDILDDAVDVASGAEASFENWLEDAGTYRDSFVDCARQLQQLQPGDRRTRAIASAASRAVVGLQKHYPDVAALQEAAKKANRALAGVDKFAHTFEDNPARRLMSLYAGAILGLLAAGLLGLDAIQAVYEGKPPFVSKDTPFWLVGWLYERAPGIGVAATGLAMGAGAAPTHELIKTLKETKERNKRNAHTTPPDTPSP